MSGEFDPQYVVARTALLDALQALGEQREAAILVGAQAIYIHTGDAGLAVAESTTDGDLAFDPQRIADDPELAEAMRSAKFYRAMKNNGAPEVGIWSSRREIDGVPAIVKVDLLMPEAVAGGGRRAARVMGHERGSVLKVRGLEGCLVDRARREITSLDAMDTRSYELMVAGPGGLLVSKLIKIDERIEEVERGQRDRRKDKDALDVLRLLRAVDMKELSSALHVLAANEVSASITGEALVALSALFGGPEAEGSLMAARAAFPEPAETIAASCSTLAAELSAHLGELAT